MQTKIKLPVTLWLRSYVEALWGTEQWPSLIEDISVKELLEYEQIEINRNLIEDAKQIIFDY